MQRARVQLVQTSKGTEVVMVHDPRGEWVSYKDVEQKLAAERDLAQNIVRQLERHNAVLTAEVESLRELMGELNIACAEWKRRAFEDEVGTLRQQVNQQQECIKILNQSVREGIEQEREDLALLKAAAELIRNPAISTYQEIMDRLQDAQPE